MITSEPIPVSIHCEDPAIETRGLVKSYRRTEALNGLDLTVPAGAFYTLVGPNGAGKSTAFRILMDLIGADVGTARVRPGPLRAPWTSWWSCWVRV